MIERKPHIVTVKEITVSSFIDRLQIHTIKSRDGQILSLFLRILDSETREYSEAILTEEEAKCLLEILQEEISGDKERNADTVKNPFKNKN